MNLSSGLGPAETLQSQQAKGWEQSSGPVALWCSLRDSSQYRRTWTRTNDRPARAMSRMKERGCHQEGTVTKGSWAQAANKRGRSPLVLGVLPVQPPLRHWVVQCRWWKERVSGASLPQAL